MASLYQTELYRIDGQLKSLLTKLKDATPSERYHALQTFERAVTYFVDRIYALNEGNSTLVGRERAAAQR
jgi:hypothetical protein